MSVQGKNGNFIIKLASILNNTQYKEVIGWKNDNTIIDILSPEKLEQEILPLYFRHGKFESFVRQLNLYGFKKVKAQDKQQFTHPLLRNNNSLTAITTLKSLKTKQDKATKQGQQGSSPLSISEGNLVGQIKVSTNFISQLQVKQNNIQKDQKEESIKCQHQERPQIIYVPINQYLMWNYMNYFHNCCPPLPQQPQEVGLEGGVTKKQ